MKYKKHEIQNALKIIKEECQASPDCELCPFGDRDGECLIYEGSPEHWTINRTDDEVWRGLI